ncbi:MAG: HIT domain-containing protein [Clostridiales bacterium]|nr:HIT domain-containing protein [Clostridiales bacterium]
MNCPFCELDDKDISNTIIEATESFLILPTKGSLCDGYLLVIPKQHLNSMNELSHEQKQELIFVLKKHREKFYEVYGKYPFFFEHGSAGENAEASSKSVTHAHIHIVNHNFKNENEIKEQINLKRVSEEEFFENKKANYISYISPEFEFFISYNFKPVSQQMRIYIANDLGLADYNWKTSNFDNNILSTIKNFKID